MLLRSHILIIGIVVVLLAVACGGSTAAQNPAAVDQAASQNDAANLDAGQSQSGSTELVEVSTNNQGNVLGTEEFGLTKEGLVTSIEQVESLISHCMSGAGFEYIAADYNTVRRGMIADKSMPGLSEKQYFDRHGFGISTLYSGQPPQLSQQLTPAQIGLGARNVQIFNNLSATDQVAYNHALQGEISNVTFAVALETEDLSRTGGCTRAAIEQTFILEQLNVSYVNPKDALIAQDPRMVAAVAAYAECMHASGFDYGHEREIEPGLRNRLAEITEGLPLEALSSEAQAALQELQSYERALAVTSYDCEIRFLEPAEDQVERELFAGRKQ